MKLEEMTNAQLVNIILRKDDVETRLRAEIATLKKENKRIGRVCWAKTIGICLLFAAICIASFTLASCDNSNQSKHREDCVDTITAIDSNHSQVINRCSMQDWGFEDEYDTISFFGESVVMDDWTGILHQIRMIAEKDRMLTYTTDVDTRVLTVCGVDFGVNIHGDNSIVLVSSTQVDDPRIESIVKYLNRIYGEATEEEPYHYWWRVRKPNSMHCTETIRLRSVSCSEEGGCVIMFNQ